MWKRIGSDNISSDKIWDCEAQNEIEGKYIGKKEAKGKMQSDLFILSVGEENIGVWASTVLETKFNEVKVGDNVKIVYLGEVVGKTGRTYRDFDIFVETDEEPLPPDF